MNKAYDILQKYTYRDIKVKVSGLGTVYMNLSSTSCVNKCVSLLSHKSLNGQFLNPYILKSKVYTNGGLKFTIDPSRLHKLKYVKIKSGNQWFAKKISNAELQQIIDKGFYEVKDPPPNFYIEFKFYTWWIF